jgi:phenylalanyl-tRNA synthetase beta chain
MRQSLLSSVLEVVERNSRLRERMALFEISPVYMASEGGALPDELNRIVMILTGSRALPDWQGADTSPMDFYDLKGTVNAMFEALHLDGMRYEPHQHPTFHPGKCARILVGDQQVGVMGELHPKVRRNYDLPASAADTPILAADLDMDLILDAVPERFDMREVPPYPPVLEDLAIVVDESLPAEQVEAVIRKAGGEMVSNLRLFDVYRGEQAGSGKKSLAYSLTYQAADRTLTDKEVAKVRQQIVSQLDQKLGAKLRS